MGGKVKVEEEHKDFFSLTDYIPSRLNIVKEAVSDLIHQTYERRFGLTTPQWRLMGNIKKAGGITQQDVVERTGMDKMAVSRAARALAERKIIERRDNAEDGRSYLLVFTDTGRALSDEIEDRAMALEEALVRGWTPAEVRRFRADLRRLEEAALRELRELPQTTEVLPTSPKIRRSPQAASKLKL